jgi:argininosuccinate lyase
VTSSSHQKATALRSAEPGGETPALWGGRFAAPASATLRRFNDSFSFDHELLAEDIEGSIAWAGALKAAGVLSAAEARRMVKGLAAIAGEMSGEALPLEQHEDVHSFVETALRTKIGPLAGKLHTGRSRNDQVATDLKLYVRKAIAEAAAGCLQVADVLAVTAEAESATAMPGYTHLKQAEPVTFGHWCGAYVAMLLRDAERLLDALGRADELPLGSGALSGTPVKIDRQGLAKALGFARPTASSLDGVSDRDFAADYLYGSAMLLGHLSRLSEDLIFFTSDEVGFATLPDAMSTGSSRMPQKKNPDVLELTRGHAARAIGELVGLLALLKGLPLAYNKDMQLDKEPLFRTRATLAAALPAIAELLSGLELDRTRMRNAASADLLLATEVADAMAARGIPFRDAHRAVSARIGDAVREEKTLRQLGPTASHKSRRGAVSITAPDLEALDVDRALSRRRSRGGTSPVLVKRAAIAARKKIALVQRRLP